jgi:hypothetical protein
MQEFVDLSFEERLEVGDTSAKFLVHVSNV